MHELRWRKGLSAAKGPERLVLLQCEHVARERAFGEWYQERCEATGSLLVDAHDLAVRSASLEWTRFEGDLLIIVTVHSRSAGRVRTFRWRGSVHQAAGRAFDSVVKRGLKKSK